MEYGVHWHRSYPLNPDNALGPNIENYLEAMTTCAVLTAVVSCTYAEEH